MGIFTYLCYFYCEIPCLYYFPSTAAHQGNKTITLEDIYISIYLCRCSIKCRGGQNDVHFSVSSNMKCQIPRCDSSVVLDVML